jgi:hypothetical protein
MFMETVYRFDQHETGLAIEVNYDTGWNASLNCSGAGGWSMLLPFNDEGTASLRFKVMSQPPENLTVMCHSSDYGVWVECDELDSKNVTLVSRKGGLTMLLRERIAMYLDNN